MPKNNSNILVPPEETDGFRYLDTYLVEHLSHCAIPQPSENNGYHSYAHTVAGSNILAEYYEKLADLYHVWGTTAEETKRPEPIAIVKNIADKTYVRLGLIANSRRGRIPDALYTYADHENLTSEDKLFSLGLIMGHISIICSGVKVDTKASDPLNGWLLDETKWALDPENGMYKVTRWAAHNAIAFGDSAIQSLEEFNTFEAGYERLVGYRALELQRV